MKIENLDELIQFRRDLHQNPELSGKEYKTQKKILNFISKFSPDKIIKNLGGTGLAAVYNGINSGPTIVFRADIDALPIHEENNFEYASKTPNVSHKCGHDGHTTMVAGLGNILQKNKPKTGRVVLLFQPAEETVKGAKKVVNDPKYSQITPDYLFAIHNFYSEEENQILLRSGQMTPAVTTALINLEGIGVHSSRPETGISPYNAATKIISKIYELQRPDNIDFDDFSMATLVHFVLGKEAGYGTAPGDAHIAITLRAYKDEVLNDLTGQIEKYINTVAKEENLKKWRIFYTDDAIACINDEYCCQVVKNAANQNNINIKHMDTSLRGGEDVGYLINTCKKGGAFFLLGFGPDHTDLHLSNYDFPEKLIEPGINMYNSIINEILNKQV